MIKEVRLGGHIRAVEMLGNSYGFPNLRVEIDLSENIYIIRLKKDNGFEEVAIIPIELQPKKVEIKKKSGSDYRRWTGAMWEPVDTGDLSASDATNTIRTDADGVAHWAYTQANNHTHGTVETVTTHGTVHTEGELI